MEENIESDSVYHNYTKSKKDNENRLSRIFPVIAGLLILSQGLIGFIIFYFFNNTGYMLYQAIGATQLIFSIAMIIAGIFAILKKHYKIALVGAIFSIFFYIIPGLIALLLIFKSEDEFES